MCFRETARLAWSRQRFEDAERMNFNEDDFALALKLDFTSKTMQDRLEHAWQHCLLAMAHQDLERRVAALENTP